MKKIVFFLVLVNSYTHAQVPATWIPRGTGGGGALFSPTINPANNNEIYMGCDMSEVFHSDDEGATWSVVNFTAIQGGHNSAVRFTNNANILYCINYANDLIIPVKSTDGGQTWNTLSGNPDPSEETYSIYADYHNPDHVLISYYGYIYFSADGGATFTLIHTAVNNGSGCTVGGVFFEGNNIYIGSNDGLIVSTNGGSSFSIINVTGLPSNERIWSFAGAKQGATTRLFCLTGDVNDIYAGLAGSDYYNFLKGIYSLDYGSGNWVSKTSNIFIGGDFLMFIAMADNDINTVWSAGGSSTGDPIVMRTTDAGATWSYVFNTINNVNIKTGWCGYGGDRGWGYAEAPFGVACAPNNSAMFVFTDFGFIHKTTTGGASWEQAYVSQADENNSGASTPKGKNYHSIGMENTTCWQVLWMDANNMFSGYSDIKGMRSTNAGQSWNFNYAGHDQNSMYRILKHPNGNLYAATSTVHDMYQSTRLQDNVLDAGSADGKIIYSSNNGQTWQTLHDFSMPVFWVERDPNNNSRMYASVINHTQGFGGIYITNDLQNGATSTWTKLPDPPRTEGHPASIVVLNDGKAVCTFSGRRNTSGTFTASSGTFIYNPVSNSWTDVSDPGMHYWTKDVVIDPNDALQNTWYVCVFSGWGGAPNGLGGLYKTTNSGTSWTKINSLDRVSSITFRPGHADEVYLTTEQNGLWNCTNINNPTPSFTQISSYPFRQPERVFFNPYNTDEIWVTSFGNGMRMGNVNSTGVESHVSFENKSIVYPNPNNGNFEIRISNPESLRKIEITDVEGRIIYSSKDFIRVLSFEKVGKGIYFLRMVYEDKLEVDKFIVE